MKFYLALLEAYSKRFNKGKSRETKKELNKNPQMKPSSVKFTPEMRADTSITARKGKGNFSVSKYMEVFLVQNQEIYINNAALCMHREILFLK